MGQRGGAVWGVGVGGNSEVGRVRRVGRAQMSCAGLVDLVWVGCMRRTVWRDIMEKER